MGKYKTKTFYLHRILAEAKLGRSLFSGEVVHHLNENKFDNSPDNLEICSSRFVHAQHHKKRERDEKPDDKLIEIDGLWF